MKNKAFFSSRNKFNLLVIIYFYCLPVEKKLTKITSNSSSNKILISAFPQVPNVQKWGQTPKDDCQITQSS